MLADIVIVLDTDGTYSVTKNRHGYQPLTGKYNELIDLTLDSKITQ